MAVNRKGVFFTVMSLLVVAFLLTSQKLSSQDYTTTKADSDAARTRISVINAYIQTFETNAQDSLQIAGYFTLQNLSKRVRTSGNFISDMNATVTLCMNNATYAFNCLNENQTLNTTISRLVKVGQTNLSITTTYFIDKVWVTEENPFEVIFWMNISYNITDPFASWQTHATIRAPVDVTGIEDPLFAYQYKIGDYTTQRYFKPTSIKNYQFDNTTFTSFYLADEYITNPDGRSVLQRYSGNLVQPSTCCGIESVVRSQYVNPLILSDPRWVNWSSVDYNFYQRSNPTFVFDCGIQTVTPLKLADFPDRNMRLDRDHLFNVYRLNGSANFTCAP